MKAYTLRPNLVKQEQIALKAKFNLYCHTLHRSAKLCPDCDALLNYALERIEQCKSEQAKPSCNNCSNSCYQAAKRLEIRHITQWAEPRLWKKHPIKALSIRLNQHWSLTSSKSVTATRA
ncbi:nitrous oxide-stimulated promoter family protein [Vibrio sp. SS-MA-C1-2]|uniref:nitrous oxide-stimulated promoter family protein n=1 Tax=Vibrio sp. SS-MA-C1-2 TaxID=2908646 RepID=UPI001F21B412|nr:nitrous oxide-stimulated promoter family protein [Vibrio sp. SS-MA-C1-2]UJF19864.1 nitrous oxide-stimulated promoter family protein [Vibrio sp. SS-MA-C1-2]